MVIPIAGKDKLLPDFCSRNKSPLHKILLPCGRYLNKDIDDDDD